MFYLKHAIFENLLQLKKKHLTSDVTIDTGKRCQVLVWQILRVDYTKEKDKESKCKVKCHVWIKLAFLPVADSLASSLG